MIKTWLGIMSGWTPCVPRWMAKTGWTARFVRVMCIALLSLARPTLASAQGIGITSVNLRQYLQGAPTPIVAPFVIPIASVVCNQTMPVTTPHSASWDDASNPGKACVYIDPGTGPLFAKVFGALEATLTNLAGTLESPESTRAPFLHPPTAPLNPKVVP